MRGPRCLERVEIDVITDGLQFGLDERRGVYLGVWACRLDYFLITI